MKILYAIQGTGNGHISRALEIVPHLQQKGKTDILVSGSQWELQTPFEINYNLHGFGFVFGKKGGVDMLRTYLRMDSARLLREIRELPVHKYDLVISDFEPVSAWACQLRKVPCIGLSNQAVTLHPLAPRPETTDIFGKLILEKYAPVTTSYGFHFRRFTILFIRPSSEKTCATKRSAGRSISRSIFPPTLTNALSVNSGTIKIFPSVSSAKRQKRLIGNETSGYYHPTADHLYEQ